MAKIEASKIWSLNYRLVGAVIADVAPAINELGLECKELFLLGEVDAHPYPAELADALFMPRPTVTVYLKRLDAAGFIKREIEPADLRRHKIVLTAAGRKVMTRGMALLSDAFGRRLDRLTGAQQAELKALLEQLS